jgi:hypothetical protein
MAVAIRSVRSADSTFWALTASHHFAGVERDRAGGAP